MTREDFGTPPTTPYEVMTLGALNDLLPSYSQTVVTGTNYTIVLPPHPTDHTMFLLEVDATADITVTVPVGVKLTTGVPPNAPLFTGQVGFWGFRYSQSAASWFLLSVTSQV